MEFLGTRKVAVLKGTESTISSQEFWTLKALPHREYEIIRTSVKKVREMMDRVPSLPGRTVQGRLGTHDIF